MPSMNGIDIISNLSLDTEEKKICNIIVISGENSLRYNLFNTSKIFRVMPKPVEFDDILSTIKEIPLENDSKKFSDSNKTVKWGIRNSIDTMNKNTSNEELCLKLKKQTFRKLTPKYFIPLAISHFNS